MTDEGQIWCATADPWYTLTCQISPGSVYPVATCWQKNPIFVIFWISAFSVVASWQQSDKVEHGCTTTNLPLSNGVKIVSVLQRLHGEIRCTISDVQKHDEQTARQRDKKTFLATKLGMVIEDLEHVLAPLKFLGSDAASPQGGH